ncbi:MAG: hypothetical protein MUF36_10040, partial [Bacteroidales bacterium]|nr:hypothetical protein [Bacteroidales bacterium]
MKRKFLTIAGLLLLFSLYARSQSFIQPNYGSKSPETLVISKIEATNNATTFFLTVENRRPGGTFCADRNIFMIYPDGTRIKLISPQGIPVCPDSHKFISIGEKLDFTLTFPPLKNGVEWIDLIEECNDNCFHFYGVTLDNELNRKLNDAFYLAENDDPVKAMVSFIDILDETDSRNLGVEGLIYVNIITLAKQSGTV